MMHVGGGPLDETNAGAEERKIIVYFQTGTALTKSETCSNLYALQRLDDPRMSLQISSEKRAAIVLEVTRSGRTQL